MAQNKSMWIPWLALTATAALFSCKHVNSSGVGGRSGLSSVEVYGDCSISNNLVVMARDNVKVEYNLSNGRATFSYGNKQKIKNFYAGVQLDKYITSTQYAARSCAHDGESWVIRNTGNGLPTMKQTFTLNGGNKFLTQVVIEGSNQSTNWIGPLVMDTGGGLDVGTNNGNLRLLWVPYDNDDHVSYNAGSLLGNEGTSSEVAAFYDNTSRNGIVVGSVTHDTWKTGVFYSGRNKLNVFGGWTNKDWTHDLVAHGKIGGSSIESPLVFVGYRDDWRDLMEEFADANAAQVARLNWSGGVPVGWNSWGKIQTGINYDKAITVSDFVKNNMQNRGFSNNNTTYINFDSYWDNLSDQQLRDFVAHARANGQKAGIYWAPFVDWGKDGNRTVDGSSMLMGDTWLRDNKNNPIERDGSYAMDPTHPATQARINLFIDRFKDLGFEYVKLDFLTHGALESTKRYDGNVKTGTQAYNIGMKQILDRAAGTMFISESIAPIFPYQYAHARRVACDTFGSATGTGSSAYLLNSASYGWWMNGRLYNYNDPDQIVLAGYSSNENMTRTLAAVVTGTVFLAGDDLTAKDGQDLSAWLLTGPRLLDIVRMGKAFRPVEGNTGTEGSSVMVMQNGDRRFLAIFNFNRSYKYSIDLARAGFEGSREYTVIDQFDGTETKAKGKLTGPLDKNYAKIFELK